MLLDRARSALIVVDVQQRLAPAVADGERVTARVRVLVEAAGRLGVPVLVSEQYPKGLGHTVEGLRAALPAGAAVVPKTRFSCAREPAFADALAAAGRDQLVVCGMEAHVCVLQSALDLLASGKAVFVAADAVGSRDPASRELGLARMRHAGCAIVNVEMALFEWLGAAGTDEFRALLPLIR